jgi:hypothetical protein
MAGDNLAMIKTILAPLKANRIGIPLVTEVVDSLPYIEAVQVLDAIDLGLQNRELKGAFVKGDNGKPDMELASVFYTESPARGDSWHFMDRVPVCVRQQLG